MARAGDVERAAGRTLWRGLLVAAVGAGYVVWWIATGYFELAPGEQAVVLRLGKQARTEEAPGWHLLHLPRPIETLDIVKTGTRHRIEFGDVDAQQPDKLDESAMQTGDNNLVLVEFVVQYRVGRPFEALYRVTKDEDLLWDVAQAAMREVVGRDTADGVLVERKREIGLEAADLMQAMLDQYEAGLVIESVQIQDAQPPSALRAVFSDALAAGQDKNRQMNEAQGYANEVVPKARGEAAELEAGARAYRSSRVSEATGEAARFRAIAAEYKRSPQITRKRLYLETLEAVLPAAEKIVAEPGSATLLPYLGLDRAREEKR